MKHYNLLFLFILTACSIPKQPTARIEILNSGTEASFRALSVVDENTAWVSGTGGTVLVTNDGGKNWLDVSAGVPDSIDFRDIEAFSSNDALILSAGSPGLVLRTEDGGQNWQTAYRDDRPEIFFDAMGFWDRNNGIAFGDAIDGRIEIILTEDGGRNWQQLPASRRPAALEGEGGFAASGTCLFTLGDSSVWIALGIPESRVIISHDRGQSWHSSSTPMDQSTGSGGIFSIGLNDKNYGLAIGGDYRNRASRKKLLAMTTDGGLNWQLVENHNLNGQKSAVTPVQGSRIWLATGATGVNISVDNGKNWSLVDSTGFYTLQMANKRTGFLSGPEGRVAKINLLY